MSNFGLNEKFWSMDGVLGRRAFIVNVLITQIITATLITPIVYIYILSMVSPSITVFLSIASVLIATVISYILLFPSFVRRIRDILATEDDNTIILTTTALMILIFICSFKVPFISLCIFIALMCIEGKITSGLPACELVKFNWGAFIGTWIWGLINKVPKTLLIIPLFLTPYAWFPFMLLCGLKGNEWAYEKKPTALLKDFHESQKRQSIALMLIVPILSIALYMAVIFTMTFSAVKYLKDNPNAISKVEQTFDRFLTNAVDIYFEKIELSDTDNKFYIEPQSWVNLSDRAKYQLFNVAVSYTLQKKEEKAKETSDDSKDEVSKDDTELKNAKTAQNVKILSSFNNEELASYVFDMAEYTKVYGKGHNPTLKELKQYKQEAYKFNNNPTLP